MKIVAPRLRSAARSFSKPVAESRKPRSNPVPYSWEQYLYFSSSSLLDDVRTVFEQMIPHFESAVKIIRKTERGEADRRYYQEHVLEMIAMTMYAAGLITVQLRYDMEGGGNDEDNIQHIVREFSGRVGKRIEVDEDEWILWSDLVRKLDVASERTSGYLNDAIGWVYYLKMGKHPVVGTLNATVPLYYETMILMVLALLDNDQEWNEPYVRGSRQSVPLLMFKEIGDTWIMLCMRQLNGDEEDPELRRVWQSVAGTAREWARNPPEGIRRRYLERDWYSTAVDAYFRAMHGRSRFEVELKNSYFRSEFIDMVTAQREAMAEE